MYDPEAIYQDADIEMMELREAGDRLCLHCGGMGYVFCNCTYLPGVHDGHDIACAAETCRNCHGDGEI